MSRNELIGLCIFVFVFVVWGGVVVIIGAMMDVERQIVAAIKGEQPKEGK